MPCRFFNKKKATRPTPKNLLEIEARNYRCHFWAFQLELRISTIIIKKAPPCFRSGTNKGGFLINSIWDQKNRLRRAKNSVFRCLGAFLASSEPSKTVAFERISKDKYSKFSRLQRAIDASDVSSRILRDKIQ